MQLLEYTVNVLSSVRVVVQWQIMQGRRFDSFLPHFFITYLVIFPLTVVYLIHITARGVLFYGKDSLFLCRMV